MRPFDPKEFMRDYIWSINKICFVMFNVPAIFLKNKNTGNRWMTINSAVQYYLKNKSSYEICDVNLFEDKLKDWDAQIGDKTISNTDRTIRIVIRTSPELIKELKLYSKRHKKTQSIALTEALTLLIEKDNTSL